MIRGGPKSRPIGIISLHTAVLVASLLAIGVAAWYLLQPASADRLYEQIMQEVQEALNGLARGCRAEDRGIPDAIPQGFAERDAEEARLGDQAAPLGAAVRESRAAEFRRDETLVPIERDYLEAIQSRGPTQSAGVAKLEAIIALFDSPENASGRAAECLELARRRLERLKEQVAQQAAGHLAAIDRRLQAADELADSDPGRAAAMYRAVAELYGDKPGRPKRCSVPAPRVSTIHPPPFRREA